VKELDMTKLDALGAPEIHETTSARR